MSQASKCFATALPLAAGRQLCKKSVKKWYDLVANGDGCGVGGGGSVGGVGGVGGDDKIDDGDGYGGDVTNIMACPRR